MSKFDPFGAAKLTDFEREHGYTPCPFRLFDSNCRAKLPHGVYTFDSPPVECDKTIERCRELGNEEHFGGWPLSASELAAAVAAHVFRKKDG